MRNKLLSLLRTGNLAHTPPIRIRMRSLMLLFAVMFSIGQVWAGVESGTTYTTDPKTPSVPANWTVNSYANDANYTKLTSNTNYIQTDEFCQNGFTSIKIKARKFGGPSAAQAVISVEWFENGGSSTVLATVSPTSTSLNDYTLSELESVTGNKSGYIKISCKEASGGKGCGVSQVTITYTAGTCTVGDPHTVSFNVGGSSASQADITEASAGAGITLPAGPTPTCYADGWTFAGWKETSAVTEQTTTAPTLLAAGTNYKPSDDVTLYAVYKKTETGEVEDASVTETFENQTAGTTYNSTQNYTVANSAAGIAWTMYYGTVSTNDKITGNNSAQMRLYSDKKAGYIQTTTPISGLQSLSFKGRVSNTNIKMSVSYSTDGENWTLCNENEEFSSQGIGLSFSSTINGTVGTNYYIMIGVGSGATFPSSSNTKLIIDDITFNYKASASTTTYLSAPSCCEKHAITIANGIENGSVSADPTAACEGATVTLTFMPALNYHLSAWTLNGEAQDIAENTFTMPGADVTVSATFDQDACEPLGTPSVTVSGKDYPYDAVKLAWTAIEHADAYKVYIYDNEDNELEHNDAFAGVEYTIGQTLSASTTYKYSVQAISNTPATYCPSVAATGTFKTDALPTAHLTLKDIDGEHASSGDHAILTPFALPSTAASCSKTFVGWDADADCATAPTYAKGAEFTFANTTGVTLYAVYADEVTPGTTSYVKTALADIASGSEVVVTEKKEESLYAMANDGGTSNPPAAVTVTDEEGVLTGGVVAKVLWTLTKDGDNLSFTKGTDKLYCTSSNNGVRVGSNANNVFAIKDNYLFNNATSRYVGVYSSQDFRCYTSINSNITGQTLAFYKKTVSDPVYGNYSTVCQPQAATPTFSPAAGPYNAIQNVTISCATSGATIYYTTDGTTPSTSSMLYESAITVDANMTIKAIAVKSEMANSAVATAEYEINLPLSTVDAIFAKAKEVKSTETDVTVTFGNWVVSATKDANAYVTDGTKGFIIYANNHGFNVGDVLSGTANCKVKMYAGSAELTTLTSETAGLTVTPNGSVDAATKTIADLDSINTGALVVLNGLFYNGSKLVDASEKEITPYSTFYSEMASKLEENHVYNITGIYVQYYATKEIAPRAAADIVDATEYVKVSFDANANDATGDLPEDVTGLIAGHNSYTIPTEKPLSREAYLQIGWNTDKDAEVALEGNLTNITADATLYAIWTAKATCEIKFYDRGNEYASKSPYQGVEYTIDVDDPEAPSGYTFAGWSASQINSEATSAELVTVVTPAAETLSFYAVYTRSEGEEVITYNKVTETPTDWAGKYLIVYEAGNVAFNGALETLDAANNGLAVEINEGVIAGSEALNAAYFTIAAATTNYSIRSASGKYIGKTANSNGLDENATTVYTNALEIDGGNAVITSSGNPTLRYNNGTNDKRFRYYKSGQQPVQLYKQHVTLPTVYYTTAPVNRYTVSFNLAEDEQGSFSPISVVEGEDATLPAEVPTKLHNTFAKWEDADHNQYAAEAVIENVTKNIVLSATWTENAHATVSYNLNGAEGEIASVEVYEGETYTLPAAPAYGTNIFGGWSDGTKVWAAKAEVTMSTVAPVTYTAQWTVVPEFNAGYWFKVTDASTLAAGQFVMIVAEDADYALGATQNSNNRSADAISKIANPAAAYYATAPAILLLQNGVADDQLGLYVTNGETKGYLYAAAPGSNHMKTQEALDVNASWKIAIENGVTTVIATGSSNRNNLLYNSGSVIFSCYTGTSSSVKNVAIYRYEESNKLQVSYAGKGTEHVQGALVDAGGSVTLAAAPAAPEAEDVTYSFVNWVVDGVEYAPAAEIANITENKVVYAKWNVETKEAATEIIIPVEDVVASDIHVKENQTVTVEVTEDVTLGNLDLENGAILEFDVTPGATVEANDLVLRSSSATNGVNGVSSQAPVMPVVNGILALEIQLRPDEMNAENSSKWYCIAAPFDVDINSGFEWVHPNGSRTPMVHNVDFQIFAYDGARRATGISGWQRISGTMHAGVAHFIGFDNARTNQNTIRLTAKTNTVAPVTEIALGEYPGATDVQNWNGVANPTMQYIGIDKDIVAFDYDIQDYNTYASTGYNYFVGSPFFIQQAGGSIVVDHTDRGGAIHAPKYVEDKLEYCVRINAASANRFESQMYVRASETASNSYEEGHDLASQCSTTPKYGARIWTENYNLRLGIEEAPLTNGNASYVLGMATPAAGEYTISVAAPKVNADLYLTYNGSIIWNLSEGAYTVELPKGVTSGYGLVLQAKAPHVATGVDNAEANEAGVQKVIINNHVYILRAEQMYDVTGKAIK